MAIGTYISIITLNINGLNAPTKRHRLVEWIQKQDTYRMKMRGWKKIHPMQMEAKESWSSNPHIRQNRP